MGDRSSLSNAAVVEYCQEVDGVGMSLHLSIWVQCGFIVLIKVLSESGHPVSSPAAWSPVMANLGGLQSTKIKAAGHT